MNSDAPVCSTRPSATSWVSRPNGWPTTRAGSGCLLSPKFRGWWWSCRGPRKRQRCSAPSSPWKARGSTLPTNLVPSNASSSCKESANSSRALQPSTVPLRRPSVPALATGAIRSHGPRTSGRTSGPAQISTSTSGSIRSLPTCQRLPFARPLRSRQSEPNPLLSSTHTVRRYRRRTIPTKKSALLARTRPTTGFSVSKAKCAVSSTAK